MSAPEMIYVGAKATVAALDKLDGTVRWKTRLKDGYSMGSDFVTLLIDEHRVYAHTGGELYCLDAQTGDVLWNNALDGLGYGLGTVSTMNGRTDHDPAIAQRVKNDAADASIAGTT